MDVSLIYQNLKKRSKRKNLLRFRKNDEKEEGRI